MVKKLIALFVIAACGGNGNVSIDSNEDNVCGEIAEVACHNLYQCCAEGEIEDFLGVSEPRTELQCRDDVERICERRANTLSDSLQDGRVRFDSALMNECLEALVAPDNTCASVVMSLPWTEACMNSAWVGTVGDGGSCFFNHDCAGGVDAFCAPNQKCSVRPGQGQACSAALPCGSAFFCQAGMCAPKITAGGMCTSTTQCAKDLFCDTSVANPVCTAKAPGGSACQSNAGCASNVCVPGTCNVSGFSCFNDASCSMRCSNNPQLTCTSPASCGGGTCSVGLNACTSTTQCVASVDDVCQFPNTCMPGDCIGDPVCSAATLTVDYCTGALSELPLF